jgi:hypothetical protein
MGPNEICLRITIISTFFSLAPLWVKSLGQFLIFPKIISSFPTYHKSVYDIEINPIMIMQVITFG